MQTLVEIADALGARVEPRQAASAVRIDRVYAGDRISDLLDEASASTLLVTNLASRQLLRLAELMDVPAICFLSATEPDPEMVAVARRQGLCLMVSPWGMFETCGKLFRLLGMEIGGRP
jgi:hypothetical protein